MMRFLNYLLAPVFVVALVGAVNAQPCGYEVTGLIDQMGRKMQMLAEDIRVEVRDARGQALAGQAYDILEQIQHMRAEAREATREHMREEAVEVDQKLHQFIEGVAALGGQGRYLARSAERVEDLDHAILRSLGNTVQPNYTQPSYVPVQPAPAYQPAPSFYPGYYVPGYQTYPQGSIVLRRGGLTISLRP